MLKKNDYNKALKEKMEKKKTVNNVYIKYQEIIKYDSSGNEEIRIKNHTLEIKGDEDDKMPSRFNQDNKFHLRGD